MCRIELYCDVLNSTVWWCVVLVCNVLYDVLCCVVSDVGALGCITQCCFVLCRMLLR